MSETPKDSSPAVPRKKEASNSQKPVEAQGKNPSEKTKKVTVEMKKKALEVGKEEPQKKRNAAKEVSEGTKTYQDELASLEGLDGPGLVPSRPDQKMVKKEDYERSQKELHEQENKTADKIKTIFFMMIEF